MNLLHAPFASIVFGILVLEDISGIIMMVALSTLAAAGSAISGTAMMLSIGGLVFFLIISFVIGIYFLPSFFKSARNYFSSETLLIFSLGLCLSMVVLASNMGFSSALGAFLMGSLLSGTIYTADTKKLLEPVKNLFSGIFFVSVGMMVDISLIIEHIVPILLLCLTLLAGKTIFSSLGVLLSGQSLKTAMQCGFSLTQLGEFAFIVANIGASYGIISDFLYPILVAVSVFTIFLTPRMVRLTDKAYRFLLRSVPKRTAVFLLHANHDSKTVEQHSEWKTFLQIYFTRVLVFCVILSFLSYVGSNIILPYCLSLVPSALGYAIAAAITLILMSPILLALMLHLVCKPDLIASLWFYKRTNRLPLTFLLFFKIAAGLFFIMQVFASILGINASIAFVAALGIGWFIYSSDFLVGRYLQIESQFLINLNAKNLADSQNSGQRRGMWLDEQLCIRSYSIGKGSVCVGRQLAQLSFPRSYYVSILEINRGGHRIPLPTGKTALLAGDTLLIIGTEQHLRTFETASASSGMRISPIDDRRSLHAFLQAEAQKPQEENPFLCYAMPIDSESPLKNSTLKKSYMHSNGKWMALGLERNNYTIINPNISFVIEQGDILWIIGTHEMISQLFRSSDL